MNQRCRIGKYQLLLNAAHQLPQYLQQNPYYDRALPRIGRYLKEVDHHLTVVDVGSNVGDTVALISTDTPGSFLCIEGYQPYYRLLTKNCRQFTDSYVETEPRFCVASGHQLTDYRISTINGTAVLHPHPHAKSLTNVGTLDDIIEAHPKFSQVNLLVVDTDGFEMHVFAGGHHCLAQAKPVIFFEFAPVLYQPHGIDPVELVLEISKQGYHQGLFYDNYGIPRRLVDLRNKSEIQAMVSLIDQKSIYYYDVLTYHRSHSRYRQLFPTELLNHISAAHTHQMTQEKQEGEDHAAASRHLEKIIQKGTDIHYDAGFSVFHGHENIILGNHVFLTDTLLNAGDTQGSIRIDDYVFFGHHVQVLARGHDYTCFEYDRQYTITEKPIHIKTGVWIGSGSIILSGVTIGEHSVVGAGSVVTRNIPDYTVYAGNPAHRIKRIKHS